MPVDLVRRTERGQQKGYFPSLSNDSITIIVRSDKSAYREAYAPPDEVKNGFDSS
jgi:hypothetical protein